MNNSLGSKLNFIFGVCSPGMFFFSVSFCFRFSQRVKGVSTLIVVSLESWKTTRRNINRVAFFGRELPSLFLLKDGFSSFS
jgi:hypothetical protein